MLCTNSFSFSLRWASPRTQFSVSLWWLESNSISILFSQEALFDQLDIIWKVGRSFNLGLWLFFPVLLLILTATRQYPLMHPIILRYFYLSLLDSSGEVLDELCFICRHLWSLSYSAKLLRFFRRTIFMLLLFFRFLFRRFLVDWLGWLILLGWILLVFIGWHLFESFQLYYNKIKPNFAEPEEYEILIVFRIHNSHNSLDFHLDLKISLDISTWILFTRGDPVELFLQLVRFYELILKIISNSVVIWLVLEF